MSTLAERLFERDPTGLIVTRLDGSRWRVGPGGTLTPLEGEIMGYTIEEFARLHEDRAAEAEVLTQDVVEALLMLARVHGTKLQLTVIGCTVLVATEGGGTFAVTVLPADDDGRQPVSA